MTLSAMSGAVDPSWTVLEAWASVTPTATTAAHAAPPQWWARGQDRPRRRRRLEEAGGGRGQPRWQKPGLSARIFLIETEFWVLLARGRGGRQDAFLTI